MTGFTLHSYFRSSTSFRVRIALNMKGVAYEQITWHLRKGEQKSDAYKKVNPQGLLPALQHPDGSILPQSMAILEWLEEAYPEPPLLPEDTAGRARVRAIAYSIACDIHPVNNLRILSSLKERFAADDEAVADWFRTWVDASFRPLEQQLKHEPESGEFCHGDKPGLADICIAAQVTNNARFNVDMGLYPTIAKIHENCMALEPFQRAAPGNQPDAE